MALLLLLQASPPLVTWTTTLGSITSGGVLTVPITAVGSGRVIASATVNGVTRADTVPILLAVPSVITGLPVGPYRLLTNAVTTAPYTLTADFNSPSTIIQQIQDARTKGVKRMLVMTGGPHSASKPGCCLAVINGVLQFNRAGWDATLATFNTAAIRQAIAAGVADGTIVGATVMDEPHVVGAGDGNTWGPRGTMTKARVDSLCAVVKGYFPTLAVGVEHQHQTFEPANSYRTCDFILDQYNAFMGPIETWRDAGLAMAARDHHQIIFSLNVLDGGVQDKDGVYSCYGAGQYGKGTYPPNCRMPAAMLKANGLALVAAGCGLFQWQWSDNYYQDAGTVASNKAIADSASRSPRRECRRS